MLKIECPECRQWLHSPFLMEVNEMTCPTCNVKVPVKEVYVAAGSFSISRDVLLKHFFKYERLLKEAQKELDEIKKEKEKDDIKKKEDDRPYKISHDNINSFIDNLKEMLEGCRSGFRIAPGEKHVRYFIMDSDHDSTLVNISMTGMCIKATDPSLIPPKGSSITVELSDGPYNFKVPGTVVWASTNGPMGIHFLNLDDKTSDDLLEYIKKGH